MTSRVRGLLFILFLVGVLMRLVVLWSYGSETNLSSDEELYLTYAENLRTTGVFGRQAGIPDSYRPPLYPAVLALLKAEAPPPYFQAALLLNVLAGALLAPIATWISHILGGSWAALATGGLALLNFQHTLLVGNYFTENLAVAFLLVLAGLLVRGVLSATDSSCWFAIGVTAALGFLIRKAMLGTVPALIVLALVATSCKPRETSRLLATLALGAAIVLAPWLIRNLVQLSQPVLISEQGHEELAVANWTAYFVRQDLSLEVARELAFARALKEEDLPVGPKLLEDSGQRLAILLGLHPALNRRFPLAGEVLALPRGFRAINVFWVPLVLLASLLSPLIIRRTGLASIAPLVLAASLLAAHAATHAIPRYAVAPLSILTVPAGMFLGRGVFLVQTRFRRGQSGATS
jgi:4-amino-4-deoxy-L-arabinose transferase-like glycosyltransferase